ncbi:lysostaphin resistance A-like protein [Rhodophyticola porphyridii]|uniref:CPBP family intramembrane glutamic endopeptidase n=1 Tax=Rhodophyticola porphyridii TaxID=1852017 RepID=UPI001B07B68C|nr:CPBP family intramembrane metalloprotease [Roseicyclus sp.]MBO6625471.1 CPBP family intramembrane metalloprotease [Roseicyclus sp.]MBO6923463.1 CPBP family intramembrane metalloprotease [Roseicyclus sp.]
MKNIRVWAAERPFAAAGLLLLVAAVYFVAPVLFLDASQLFGHGRQEQGASEFADGLWAEIGLAGVLVLAVLLLGWTRETGLTIMPRWRASLFAVPYIALVLLMVLVTYGTVLVQDEAFALTAADWRMVGVASFVALVVGLFEELLFRGVLLHGLRSKMPAIPAVLVAALIFGAFHFVNWVGGQPFDVTVMQVISAAGGGVFYGALVLWTGSLWPSIIMHGLWDAAVTLNQTMLGAGEIMPEPADGAAGLTETAYNPLSALLSPELIYGLILLGLWAWWNHRRSTSG